ncbi:kinase-like protein [Coprinellus micaceus]|uniref:Kinase-like protein n=1 Tax=Coprinellus micaceus TaxID=71717 RepID=A0A4Y7SHM6_COPMI|nr:kinase-like protein [Coprinellus micaceus]
MCRYRPSSLEEVEDLETYVENGNHPCSIGDTLSNGRYQILHKLGFGGSSTVWLARDRGPHSLPASPTRALVTMKIMAASLSTRPPAEVQEITIPERLCSRLARTNVGLVRNIQSVQDCFFHNGPNGHHLCIVSPVLGPSVLAIEDFLSVEHHTRIRKVIAQKIAKEAAVALEGIHSAGVVHGDFTTSNLLLALQPGVSHWTDREVYETLGKPTTEAVVTQGNQSPIHAPREVVEAASIDRLSSYLSFSVVVSDFGQSFLAKGGLPKHLRPATVTHYTPPEMRFEGRVDFASDIWMLACAIYEIRAGHSLFDSFLRSDSVVTMEMVSALGRLPDPWWSKFDSRHKWFNDSGEPRPVEEQERDGVMLICEKETLRQMVQRIGRNEEPPVWGTKWDPLTEALGPLSEGETDLLTDLLEKTLRYNPAERLTIQEVIKHPWFDSK